MRPFSAWNRFWGKRATKRRGFILSTKKRKGRAYIASAVLSLRSSQVVRQAGAYPRFYSIKWQVFQLPLDGWDYSFWSVTLQPPLSKKFAGQGEFNKLMKRGTVGVKCVLPTEHNAVPRPGLEPGTAQYGVLRTNHLATAFPTRAVPPSSDKNFLPKQNQKENLFHI